MVNLPIQDFLNWFYVDGSWSYTDDHDPIINVQGDVKLKWMVSLSPAKTRLPYTFGEVTGNFDCHACNVKDLTGTPRKVGGNFIASYSPLVNLKNGPEYVGGDYRVATCPNLTDLTGIAKTIGGQVIANYHPNLNLLAAVMSAQHVLLTKPTPSSTWEDIEAMNKIQPILDEYAGEGKSGALKLAAKLVKLGFKSMARL